jgi:hypothetical protein
LTIVAAKYFRQLVTAKAKLPSQRFAAADTIDNGMYTL